MNESDVGLLSVMRGIDARTAVWAPVAPLPVNSERGGSGGIPGGITVNLGLQGRAKPKLAEIVVTLRP